MSHWPTRPFADALIAGRRCAPLVAARDAARRRALAALGRGQDRGIPPEDAAFDRKFGQLDAALERSALDADGVPCEWIERS